MSEIKKIRYGGQTIDLPAGMTLEDAKAQMARFFPELSEPKVETVKKDDVTTYVFSKQAGRKGALTLPYALNGDEVEICASCLAGKKLKVIGAAGTTGEEPLKCEFCGREYWTLKLARPLEDGEEA